MRRPPIITAALLLLLVSAASTTGGAESPAGGASSPAGSFIQARVDFTATALPDGRVLVVGGWDGVEFERGVSSTAEVWDPRTLTFEPAGELAQPRAGQTAVLLPDGRVLVVGGTWVRRAGGSFAGRVADAEIWDPETATFSYAGTLGTARGLAATVTRLSDGRVLVVGGAPVSDDSSGPVLEAELWDPASMAFGVAGTLDRPRNGHRAFPLADGGALIVGPGGREALRWNPDSMRFRPVGKPDGRRAEAHQLADGRVLLVGVDDPRTCRKGRHYANTPDAELWIPGKDRFVPAGAFKEPRNPMSVTPLPDGRVLFYGGWDAVCNDAVPLRSAESWDPATRSFERAGHTTVGREGHTATLLDDGRVVLAGGQGQSPPDHATVTLDTIEVWEATTRRFAQTGRLGMPRWGHTATLLPDGRILVLGGRGPDGDILDSAEVWDPGGL